MAEQERGKRHTIADNIFYVYQYLDEAGKPYYIGKGSGGRINRLHNNTMLPPPERRVIIENGLSNEEAKKLEVELITRYKRKLDGGILDNIKINQWACHAGWTHSEETKRKISEGNKGKVRSEAHNANYCKPKTAEHAEKIRQANLGRPYDPVRAAKISATLKARNKARKEQLNG